MCVIYPYFFTNVPFCFNKTLITQTQSGELSQFRFLTSSLSHSEAFNSCVGYTNHISTSLESSWKWGLRYLQVWCHHKRISRWSLNPNASDNLIDYLVHRWPLETGLAHYCFYELLSSRLCFIYMFLHHQNHNVYRSMHILLKLWSLPD